MSRMTRAELLEQLDHSTLAIRKMQETENELRDQIQRSQNEYALMVQEHEKILVEERNRTAEQSTEVPCLQFDLAQVREQLAGLQANRDDLTGLLQQRLVVTDAQLTAANRALDAAKTLAQSLMRVEYQGTLSLPPNPTVAQIAMSVASEFWTRLNVTD